MVPTTKQIVWQIAVMHELYPKDTISEIASKLALSPIFIINALDEGERMEFFKRKRDKKGGLTEVLETIAPVDWQSLEGDEFGPDYERVQTEIMVAVANANRDEQDLELGTIMAWCRGINPSAVEVALAFLYHKVMLGRYELADPADAKSKYTFYTLRDNGINQWGKKQFKKEKKS